MQVALPFTNEEKPLINETRSKRQAVALTNERQGDSFDLTNELNFQPSDEFLKSTKPALQTLQTSEIHEY